MVRVRHGLDAKVTERYFPLPAFCAGPDETEELGPVRPSNNCGGKKIGTGV